jgi:hypothetical protein
MSQVCQIASLCLILLDSYTLLVINQPTIYAGHHIMNYIRNWWVVCDLYTHKLCVSYCCYIVDNYEMFVIF